jgi:hypothetical protein|uniref:Uncharacterized protein n=1 Tax=Mus musculus TaxID=10090 RepID=Q8BQU9_MOUSE|nr:unnamed protein product [Mus musculus]
MCSISIYSGNAPGTPSPPAAADFSTAAGPRYFPERPGALPVEKLVIGWCSLPDPGAPASSSGRWWGDGVKTRVEGQEEISYAQTITMGSKPQNIYLFQPNDSIKWTPAMFLSMNHCT